MTPTAALASGVWPVRLPKSTPIRYTRGWSEGRKDSRAAAVVTPAMCVMTTGGGCFFAMIRIRVQAIRCDDSGDGRGVAAIGPGGERGVQLVSQDDSIAGKGASSARMDDRAASADGTDERLAGVARGGGSSPSAALAVLLQSRADVVRCGDVHDRRRHGAERAA